MEKKTRYRIFGILIIFGLLVILLPLFLSENEEQVPEVAIIKSPPFPEQAVQISENSETTATATEPTAPIATITSSTTSSVTSSNQAPASVPTSEQPLTTIAANNKTNMIENDSVTSPNMAIDPNQSITQPQDSSGTQAMPPTAVPAEKEANSEANTQKTVDNRVLNAPVDESRRVKASTSSTHAIPTIADSASTVSLAAAIAAAKEEIKDKNNSINADKSSAHQKEQPKQQTQNENHNALKKSYKIKLLQNDNHQPTHSSLKKKTATTVKLTKAEALAPLSKNGLFDLKKPAWIIQIGSFKNKTNAMRLVNRLRSNGYKAFVQHIENSAFGETIRVYVGPEDQQSAAHELADKMEKELHVAGIVISYKPLSL